MREIPLTQGKVALVDDEDYEELAQYKWFADKMRHTWYATRNITIVPGKRTTVSMHRQIVGAGHGQQVDHWDGDGLHNWRQNLRSCTNQENGANRHHRRAGCTSRYRGVSWDKKAGKWLAQIRGNHQNIRLGGYDQEDDAALAYNAAAVQYFGDFASLNVIA